MSDRQRLDDLLEAIDVDMSSFRGAYKNSEAMRLYREAQDAHARGDIILLNALGEKIYNLLRGRSLGEAIDSASSPDIFLVEQTFSGQQIETDSVEEAVSWILGNKIWTDKNLAKRKPTPQQVAQFLAGVPNDGEMVEQPLWPFEVRRWPREVRSKSMMSKYYVEPTNEMAAAGITGFQAPLGVKQRKEALDKCVDEAGDITRGQVLLFLKESPDAEIDRVCELLDFHQHELVADAVREHVVRSVVRRKIREVVRKKAGGGGYVLYAPNRGKKNPSQPIATFPTKLAAKRAELARVPPKDPKKLTRLRKEVAKLMKDPKKRAEAEKRAQAVPGTDLPQSKPKKPAKEKGRKTPPRPRKPKKPAAAPAAKKESFNRAEVEAAILSEAVIRGVRARLSEGLFREERQDSEWDEVIGKISDRVLMSDRGYQRVQRHLQAATEGALSKAVRIVQKMLGGDARVKAAQKAGQQDGKTYMPFHVQVEAASVGPIYLYVDRGLPAIEMSDEAKNGLTKVTPGAARAIRAALATAQDALEKVSGVAEAVAERDAYLDKLEHNVDRMVATLSPLGISLMKMLLVKKYRSVTK